MITKNAMVVLSAGLVAMWIIGLLTHASAWLSWLDLVAGIVSILAVLIPMRDARVRNAAPFVIAVGLTVLWIAAFGSGDHSWLPWLTFVASLCYYIVGASEGGVIAFRRRRARA